MKITKSALRELLREASKGSGTLLPERPWSTEHTFTMRPGGASDSEGPAADGLCISLSCEAGTKLDIVLDSYWNPQQGDQSGNSIKVLLDEDEVSSTYVPHKFDDGRQQRIVVSNTPVEGVLTIAHSPNAKDLPVVYLVVQNPFLDEQEILVDARPIGNGKVTVKMTDSTNL